MSQRYPRTPEMERVAAALRFAEGGWLDGNRAAEGVDAIRRSFANGVRHLVNVPDLRQLRQDDRVRVAPVGMGIRRRVRGARVCLR